MESPFLHGLCIEPDDGVFYHAALPESLDAGAELQFTRLQNERDVAAIHAYLRTSEGYRMNLLRPYLEQDRENIARLAYSFIRPGLGEDQLAQFPTYEAYVDYFAARGRPDVLKRYADRVLTGEREQLGFVHIARRRIPDWKAMASATEEERGEVAGVLNALLPATGGKGSWQAVDAAALALPDAGRSILAHLKGANLAFAEVIDDDGQRTIYYALSGGKRGRNVQLRQDASLGDGTRFVDARKAMQGVAPLQTITSLPVVRNLDNLEARPFGREVDSERLIASAMEDHPRAISFKLWTLQDTCRSCGGVVMQQLRNRFPDADPFSVRYMVDYGSPARVPEPLAAAAERLAPDAGLVTYFDQWRQDAGMR